MESHDTGHHQQRRRCSLARGLLSVYLIVGWWQLDAQEERAAANRESLVLIVAPSGGSVDAIPAQTVAELVALEVTERGVPVTIVLLDAMPSLAAMEDAQVARLARTRLGGESSQQVLGVTYRVAGEEFEIAAVWYDASAAAVQARSTAAGRFDLHLDSVVAAAVAELAPLIEATADRLTSVEGEAGNESAGGETAVGTNDGSAISQGSGSAATGRAGTDGVVAGGQRDARPGRPLVLAASSHLPLVIGRSSSTARFGVAIVVSASYHMELTANSQWSAGLTTGMVPVQLVGSALTIEGVYVPLGIEVGLAQPGSWLTTHAHVAGGAAIFATNPAGGGTVAKLLPFIWTRLGVDVAILPALTAQLALGYVALLEGSFPLTAFVPSVGLSWRL